MKNYNSDSEITKWMTEALNNEYTTIAKESKERLRKIGTKLIKEGYWREDISEAWMKLGFTTADIYDLYP